MDKNDLFNSIGEISDQILAEAEVPQKRKKSRMIWFIAASLVIVFTVFGFFRLLPVDQSIPSLFTLTAQAVEGDWSELKLNEGFFNCGETDGSSFPEGIPLFDFTITPSDRDNHENEYGKFKIVVSYNGKNVESQDDHVAVYHIFPLYATDRSYSYQVIGWFEETTDIDITIVDTGTEKIVEVITVNVEPLQEEGVYRLTVTNVETNAVKQKGAK